MKNKKYKRIKIKAEEYNKIINEIIKNNNNLPVHETLIKLLEEASKYEIIGFKKIKKKKK
jgi:hypothetical protein